MIVEKDTDIEQFGQLTGKTIQMGFAAEAIGQLMDNMAKTLYSRPKEAVLREYSTNALDAQIEAGYSGPIEVTLPNSMNPVLKIRDHGVGLDGPALENVYSQYGASTKRDSNDFNGTLGLGCKSAFAYTNRFVVVSVKDGVRYEIVVTRSEDGTAEMVVMDPRRVNDPNGVEIQIPTKRGDTFGAEAEKVYKWFPRNTVKVNGQTIDSWLGTKSNDALEIAPGMFVVDHSEGSRYGAEQDDLIVMGNVAYPYKLETELPRRTHHLVCFVDNGAVQFMSSREALLNNSVTRRKVDDLTATFKKAIIDTVQKHIDAAPTRSAAAAVVSNWKAIVPANVVPAGGYEYKGLAIPSSCSVDSADPHIRVLPTQKSGYHNSHSKNRSVPLERFHGSLWIEGFTPDAVTASHAQKARQYIQEQKLTLPNGIVLIHQIPSEVKPWIERVISYDDLKAVKLPRQNYTPGSSGRIPGSYDLHTTEPTVLAAYHAKHPRAVGGTHVTHEGIAAETFRHWTVPLFYMVGNRHDSEATRAALSEVQRVQGSKGYTLIVMRADRVDKFRRNFPAAKEAYSAIRDGYAAWAASAGADAGLGISIQQDWTARNYQRLAAYAGQIADPEFKNYVELAAKDLTSVKAAATMFQRVLSARTTKTELIDFTERYPLLESGYPDHTIFYINAVYAARQAGQKL